MRVLHHGLARRSAHRRAIAADPLSPVRAPRGAHRPHALADRGALPGLAYAGRLGLWAAGETPFETRPEFVSTMESGGVAALEVVARDLKALGLYQARALSYDGVEVEILEHPLTDAQRRIYDAYAGAFKVIHHNIEEALKSTGIVDGESTLNKNAKSAALSAFVTASSIESSRPEQVD